jgi:transglutaminase-like putative cysteine protease
MYINVGCEVAFSFPLPTALVLMLRLHPSVASSVRKPERLYVKPSVPIAEYADVYGNRCSRIFVPAGRVEVGHSAIVEDSGQPDLQVLGARQDTVQELPPDVLLFLLPSRYCEVDSELKELAWALFGHLPAGWPLVQGICNWVNQHIRFDYMQARANRTALDIYRERAGVCRDYMHLAITFCRCLNVPARYCTGYLGDIGVPPAASPMDFSAWFEVYLGKQWYAFDARNNTPRIGRILVARGRDAADVAITTSFGLNKLESFRVWTDEISANALHWPS